MKSTVLIFSLIFSFSAVAEDAAPAQGGDITQAKADMTARLDKRIATLQEAKTCVSNAKSRDDMKKCHEALKEDRMEMRQEHLNKKEAKLKERLQKIESQKAKAE